MGREGSSQQLSRFGLLSGEGNAGGWPSSVMQQQLRAAQLDVIEELVHHHQVGCIRVFL